jgi:hypothetical protein
VPGTSSVELTCRHQANQHNRPQQATAPGRAIQAWPVHEDGWQRELLRTEVEVEFD